VWSWCRCVLLLHADCDSNTWTTCQQVQGQLARSLCLAWNHWLLDLRLSSPVRSYILLLAMNVCVSSFIMWPSTGFIEWSIHILFYWCFSNLLSPHAYQKILMNFCRIFCYGSAVLYISKKFSSASFLKCSISLTAAKQLKLILF